VNFSIKNFLKKTKNKLVYFFDLQKERKNKHEYYLLKNARRQKSPNSRQIFCIGKVLSPKEKTIFFSAIWIFVISFVWSAYVFSLRYKIEVPKIYGEYTEGVLGSLQHINPIFASLNEVDQDLCSMVYSGLLKYDEKRNLITDLAVKYEINEAKTEYIFELKKDVLWHDNTNFTADDVIFTFDLIQEAGVASPLQLSFKDIKVEKIDDYKIKFILPQSSASFLSSLTVGILPQHIWSAIPYEQVKLAQRNLQPIGTGPYKFDKLVKDETGYVHRIDLVRNENYYKIPAYIKKISFEFFSDYDGPDGLINALREQEINGISFVPYEYRSKIERKHINIHTLQLPQYTALFFNLTKLDNKDLRLALAESLDKERIVKDVLENEAKTIEGPILESYPGFSVLENKITFSVSKANELLDKNWEKISAEEYRELLKKEKVEYLIKQQEENQNTTSSTENGENVASVDETELTENSTNSSTMDLNKINEDVENELNTLLDPAQIFYRYKKGSEDKKNILEINLVTVATPEYTKVAQLISGYWQDTGIKVNVSFVDAQDFTKEVLKTRNYDVLLYGVLLGNDPDQYPFWHSDQINYPGLNLSSYANNDVDKLLQEIRVAKEEEKVAGLYAQVQEKILADIPAIFLYTPTYTYAQEDYIKGFSVERISEPSDRFSNVVNWYVKTKMVWDN